MVMIVSVTFDRVLYRQFRSLCVLRASALLRGRDFFVLGTEVGLHERMVDMHQNHPCGP